MATSVTSQGLVAAADKVILSSRPYLEFIKLFSTNLEPVNGAHYSAIAVNVLAASSEDFGAGAGYTHPTNTIKPATVTLASHRKSTFTVSDVDALTNELAPAWAAMPGKAAEGVAQYVVQTVMALLTYSNATAQITQTFSSGLADFTALSAAAIGKGLDPAQCVLILEPTTYSKLIAAIPANILGDDEAIRTFLVGKFLGYKAVVCSPNCSKASAGDANNGVGFIVPEGAIAIANRVVVPVKAGGNLIEFGTVTDEATGWSFGLRSVVDADQGTLSVSVDTLFGAALSKQSSNGAPGYYQIKTA
ncbi:MAG: hypothetical protein IIZ06_00210 [Kiritimatiellae bacterium]|nr:hypothetical protein [Kiritimatiellia bacterium]